MYAPRQYKPEKKRPSQSFLALSEPEQTGPVMAPPGFSSLDSQENTPEDQKAEQKAPEGAENAVQNKKAVEGSAGLEGLDAEKSTAQKKAIGRSEQPPQFKLKSGAPFQFKYHAPMQMKTAAFNEANASAAATKLPEEVVQQMSTAFGASFHDIQIIANSTVAKTAGALAFAQGREIHFAPGQYNPTSPVGLALIGHELTHIVQQQQGRVKATKDIDGMPVNDDPALELEADRLGAMAAKGFATGLGTIGTAAAPIAQMKVESPAAQGPENAPNNDVADSESTMEEHGPQFSKLSSQAEDSPEESPSDGAPTQMKLATAQFANETASPAAESSPAQGAPATVVDISNGFNPPKDVADFLNENHNVAMEINAKMGEMASGKVKVRQKTKGAEDGSTPGEFAFETGQYLEFKGDAGFLEPLRAKGLIPVIALNAGDLDNITGVLTLKVGETVLPDPKSLITQINENLEGLGLLGIDPLQVPEYTNEVIGGVLTLMAPELSTEIGGFLNASGTFGFVGNTFVFSLHADIDIQGMAQGSLDIERTEQGTFLGEAEVGIAIENVSGNIKVIYTEGKISGRGEGAFESEKFKGSLTLIFDEKSAADQAVHEGMGVELMEGNQAAPAPTQAEGPRVVAGFGSVEVQLTPWLTSTAMVGVDSEGHVTIHGSMTFPDQIELMEQKDKKHDLFNVELKAGYGVPLVGQIFLFASLGMFVKAGFGPLALHDIGMEGTYSTDPNVLNNFKITGALGISAYAQVGLSVKAGAGLTLIGHDIKAGIDLTASAGIQAYAEARPTFEYFETDAGGQKMGEAHLKGHFEAAARLFLELAGAFFVELDSPWWSPAPDKTWEWPFGSLVYPVGDEMGVAADVDWLVGSPDVPELTFSPVQFDPDKFLSDMTKEPENLGQEGKGGDEKKDGSWTDAAGGGGENGTEPTLDRSAGGAAPAEEDLKALPDEEKYMRALDEVGKIGDAAKGKPLAKGALDKKLKAIKSKYGLGSITMVDPAEESVKVEVKHKAQINSNNLIEIKLVSKAEQDKQFSEAVADLETALKTLGDPETGAITKAQAETAAHEVDLAHEVIDGTQVKADDKEVTIKGDVGEEHRKMLTKPVAKGLGDEAEGADGEKPEGKENALKNLKAISADSEDNPYTEEEINFVVSGLKSKYEFKSLNLSQSDSNWILDEEFGQEISHQPNEKTIQRKESKSTNHNPEKKMGQDSRVYLPGDVQKKMSSDLKGDFSGVKFFEGPDSDKVNAEAYTQGDEVHFSEGKFQPNSADGQELIAHELGHVVQQSKGNVNATSQVNGKPLNDDPSLERNADEMASNSTDQGKLESLDGLSNANGAPIQRQIKVHKTMPNYKLRADQEGEILNLRHLDQLTDQVISQIPQILDEMASLNAELAIEDISKKLTKEAVKAILKKLIEAPAKVKKPDPSEDLEKDKRPARESLDRYYLHQPDLHDLRLYETKDESGIESNDAIKDLARKVAGDLASVDNKQKEKKLAEQAMASAWVKSTVKRTMQRIYQWIYQRDEEDKRILVSAFEDILKEGSSKYFPWYIDYIVNVGGDGGNILKQLMAPNQGQLVGNIAIIHDVMEHFAIIASGKTSASQELTEVLAKIKSVPKEKQQGQGTVENRISLGDYRAKDTSLVEFNTWVMTARAKNMPLDSGPSMTTARMLETLAAIGGTPAMNKAVAWAIFGLWNTTYYRSFSGIHTFHEVMDIAKNYGVPYTPFQYPDKAP